MDEKIPISVVIIAKNEEENIGEALQSVGWSDDIIVVDGFSRDATRQIAAGFTDRIFQREQDVEGIHRNWAYTHARNAWVLSLDADESVSPDLARELNNLIRAGAIEYAAFTIPLRNYIGRYWVKHGGWYPAAKVRLFLKDKFRYEEVGVHPRAFIDGSCGHLKGDIIHKGYPTVEHFLQSLNYQTTQEAKKWFNEKRKVGYLKIFRKSLDRFLRSLILKRGYKDGAIGFTVAYFAGLYQMMSFIKYKELLLKEEKLH